MKATGVLVAGLLLALPLLAQQSPEYQMTEYTFNAGGETSLTSSDFQITFAAVGEATVQTGMSSSEYGLECSLGAGLRPPSEVQELLFTDVETLAWEPDLCLGDYNMYRDTLSHLPGPDYGLCAQQDLEDPTATDAETPPVGQAYFYLVTSVNRLEEEGTKGSDSSGSERPNPNPCP